MKFVMLLVAMVTVSLSVGKLPGEKKVCSEGENARQRFLQAKNDNSYCGDGSCCFC